jgi:hypothetical protein
MRWWAIVITALGAAASIGAVVWAIARVTGHGDLQRIKTALALQTNCAQVAITRPSRAQIVTKWAGMTAQTADVRCTSTGAGLVYAKFGDSGSLDRALATDPPSTSYCRLGNAILIDHLVQVASTAMSDTCQSLGGTLIPASD